MSDPHALEVLIVASGRDGDLTFQVLDAAGHRCRLSRAADELLRHLSESVGVVIVAEELLDNGAGQQLAAYLAAQPAWSDLPILVVAAAERAPGRLPALGALGNVSVLTRPMAVHALTSSVKAALRARRRQFEVRALLAEQQDQVRQRDEFLAMLAHELRNPLAPVRYSAQALRLARVDGPLSQLTDVIERQVGHMARIVDDLLDVSRVTRGLIRLSVVPFDIAKLAARCVEAHAPAAADRTIRLSAHADGAVWIRGDETRIRQLLENLIDNALKFSTAGGTVDVTVREVAGRAELAVADTGEGISGDVLPRLFKPFTQADRSLERRQGGLGLGLALVRGIARLHGGDVEAQSAGHGRGSTFTVHFPACESPALTDPPREAAPAPASTSHASLVVVIAEDNLDAAESLRLLLELTGHRVHVVHDGRSAVEVVRRVQPDVFVCDVGLPGMNGYDVVRELRRDAGSAEMHIIAVTGYGSAEDRATALACGFHEHLPKPVEPARLLEEIAKAEPRTGALHATHRLHRYARSM